MRLETKEYKTCHGKTYLAIMPESGDPESDCVGEIWDAEIGAEIVKRFNEHDELKRMIVRAMARPHSPNEKVQQ